VVADLAIGGMFGLYTLRPNIGHRLAPVNFPIGPTAAHGLRESQCRSTGMPSSISPPPDGSWPLGDFVCLADSTTMNCTIIAPEEIRDLPRDWFIAIMKSGGH
jgi:hypothetical protein